jgi:hypothetical protein
MKDGKLMTARLKQSFAVAKAKMELFAGALW